MASWLDWKAVRTKIGKGVVEEASARMHLTEDLHHVSKRVTQATIGRKLGISAMTVSNALNGTGRVSAWTREQVRRVAAELGYRQGVVAGPPAALRIGRLPGRSGPNAGAAPQALTLPHC